MFQFMYQLRQVNGLLIKMFKKFDLNPMENLWGIMSRRIYGNGHQYSTVEDLKKSVQTAWRSISTETLKSLSSSIKDRIFACTLKRCSYTKF